MEFSQTRKYRFIENENIKKCIETSSIVCSKNIVLKEEGRRHFRKNGNEDGKMNGWNLIVGKVTAEYVI